MRAMINPRHIQAHERLIEAAPALLDALEDMIGLTIQLLARKDLPAEVRHQLTGSGHILKALNAIAAAEGRE